MKALLKTALVASLLGAASLSTSCTTGRNDQTTRTEPASAPIKEDAKQDAKTVGGVVKDAAVKTGEVIEANACPVLAWKKDNTYHMRGTKTYDHLLKSEPSKNVECYASETHAERDGFKRSIH